ncbi:hypothetical protein B0T18DRAFT_405342 [Schizothecium vesticola]|uniref:Uncharacterized protein n=1 Tax=Schizothecium vesticola TaxID=314040 RepID=A0AA40F7J2_9PEZI|nr:hypothetical protein B0T18DRAFT_405342 [Schizothecium vesticola]
MHVLSPSLQVVMDLILGAPAPSHWISGFGLGAHPSLMTTVPLPSISRMFCLRLGRCRWRRTW